MTIGLFGGTFDPPHAGHVLASETALRRLDLDRVWWLVTPGNPLKDIGRLRPLATRMAEARALTSDPRIVVTDIEARIGTRYTFDTLDWLTRRCPGVRFVWIMGADILAQLHRWQKWREIAELVPFAVVDRPGASFAATASPAAQALARWRVPEARATNLARIGAPAFVILHGKRVDLSSTMLRKQRSTAAIGSAHA
jgi:nicotinate-nucleotide adenylyltransferase